MYARTEAGPPPTVRSTVPISPPAGREASRGWGRRVRERKHPALAIPGPIGQSSHPTVESRWENRTDVTDRGSSPITRPDSALPRCRCARHDRRRRRHRGCDRSPKRGLTPQAKHIRPCDGPEAPSLLDGPAGRHPHQDLRQDPPDHPAARGVQPQHRPPKHHSETAPKPMAPPTFAAPQATGATLLDGATRRFIRLDSRQDRDRPGEARTPKPAPETRDVAASRPGQTTPLSQAPSRAQPSLQASANHRDRGQPIDHGLRRARTWPDSSARPRGRSRILSVELARQRQREPGTGLGRSDRAHCIRLTQIARWVRRLCDRPAHARPDDPFP
jgi:hypothetical protein